MLDERMMRETDITDPAESQNPYDYIPATDEGGMNLMVKRTGFKPNDETPPLPEDLAFDPEGSGYDEQGARAAGLSPDETGHWPSRDPKTGMIFKGRSHETWPLTEKGEADQGLTIVKDPQSGRYHSTNNPADFAAAQDDEESTNPADYIPAADDEEAPIEGERKTPFLTNVMTSAEKAQAAGQPVYYIAGAGKGEEARGKGFHYVHEESPRDTAEREQMIAQREGRAAPGGKGERPFDSFKKLLIQKMGYDPESLDPAAERQKGKQAYLDSQFGGKPFYEIDAMSPEQINRIHKDAEKEGAAAEARAKYKRINGMKMILEAEKRFEKDHDREVKAREKQQAEIKAQQKLEEQRAYEERKYRERTNESRSIAEKRRIEDQDYRDHTAKEKAAMVNDTDRIRVLEKSDRLIKDENVGAGEAISPATLKRINDMRADANMPQLRERKVGAERTFMGIPYGEAEKEGWTKYEEETKDEEAQRLKDLARQQKLTEKEFRAYLNRVGTVGRAQHILITAYKAKGLLQ